MSTPPSWFPNPANPNEEVYWDGDRWTGDKRLVYGADPHGDVPVEPGDVVATEAVHPADPRGSDAEAGQIPHVKPEPAPRPRKKRTALWVALIAVVAILLVGGVTTAVVANNVHAQQVAEQKALAKKKADEQRAQEAAAAAKQAADDATRSERKDTVTQVEASIKKMAEDDISKGLLTGPVISVSCNPVSGSTDDLTDTTTTFDCFVANKDNGDGTSSGYFFNATVNWNSGTYTYGLGKSGG
jgi:hypothetical protein